MNEHDDFIRSILNNPDDLAPRLIYADWLDEQSDPRGDYVRWQARLLTEPDTKHATIRTQLQALQPQLPPAWSATFDTLAMPFIPEEFDYEEGDLPFEETLGRRGPLVTFASQLNADDYNPGLVEDLTALCALAPGAGECYYGASTFAIEPFMCRLPTTRRPLLAIDVLEALQAHLFASEHIDSLQVARLHYPGYHPDSDNDEIHNDYAHQYLFEQAQADPNDPSTTHGFLKQQVDRQGLWYVLLHPERHGGYASTVFLLAVGASRFGSRLVGVFSQQVCHNLCD